MKYTNKYDYPDYVVAWLKHDNYDYDENTISATTLMKPPRQYALMKQNWDNLEIDVSDVIASRYGTAIHDSVEKVDIPGCIQEKRLKKPVMNKIITGKFDILKEVAPGRHRLIDVKSTSVWTYIYGSKDEDYITQLSIYRWLAIQNGYNVETTAEIFMVFTDWSKSKSQLSSDYPQSRIAIKTIELWGEEKTLKYIGERIKLLDSAIKQEQEVMPKCTSEELWETDPKYRVIKTGRKSALKVAKSFEEAQDYINDKVPGQPGISIKKEPGEVKRCAYCTARKFCTQYKDMVATGRCKELD